MPNQFKKVLKKKTSFKLKNDGSDLLIYLIYVDYLQKLSNGGVENGQISLPRLTEQHNHLLRTYKQ